MKKTICAFLAILLVMNIVSAQHSDHLRPTRFVVFGPFFDYHKKVREILFEGISDLQVVQFIVFPSFGSESVMTIEVDAENVKNVKYYLVYHKCKKSVWRSMQRTNSEKIEVDKHRKIISIKSVDMMKKLFGLAISQTRAPGNSGFDGTTYYFGYIYSGEVWSPREGTKMGELVAISNEIIKLAKNENDYIEFDEVLIRRIKNLTNRLIEE